MVSTGSKHSTAPQRVQGAVYGYHTCLFSLAAPKLTGPQLPESFASIRCEAYGPGGAAVIVDCRIENRDRTVAQVRQVVREHGGYPGAPGSVSYLFNEVGRLVFPPGTDAARLSKAAIQAGAEDVIPASLEVLTDPIDFESVRGALQAAGFVPVSAEVTRRASITVALEGEAAISMVQLIQALKDLDDVENVYTNAEIPDEVVARL
jgi:transcriptional/translational regulatory protein YebC/TACO1